jgi:hypothetical protein
MWDTEWGLHYGQGETSGVTRWFASAARRTSSADTRQWRLADGAGSSAITRLLIARTRRGYASFSRSVVEGGRRSPVATGLAAGLGDGAAIVYGNPRAPDTRAGRRHGRARSDGIVGLAEPPTPQDFRNDRAP